MQAGTKVRGDWGERVGSNRVEAGRPLTVRNGNDASQRSDVSSHDLSCC